MRIEPRTPDCALMSVSLGCMFTTWGRSKIRNLEGGCLRKVAEGTLGRDWGEKEASVRKQ